MKKLIVTSILSLAMVTSTYAQDNFNMPEPSPSATIHQSFSTSFIEINYSRPSARERTIFGNVVQYDKLWRTGANAATKIKFGEDVFINKNKVEAGEYALYTIPGKEEWTIILNKGLKNWGSSGYSKSDDVLRITVPSQQLEAHQETFEISIQNIGLKECDIVLAWDATFVSFPILAKNNERILSYLEKELKGKNPPYSTAAGYYLRTNQHLDKAVEYYKKAMEENPKAFYFNKYLAKVYLKLGKNEEAIKYAKIAADKAKGSPYEGEYEKHYQTILEATKK